jgi:hypothetical protein
MQPQRPALDPDSRLLAALIAWEEFFGQKPISWAEVRDLEMGLNPEEARVHLQRGVGDLQKAAAYRALLEHHPELREVLDRTVQRWTADATAEVMDAAEAAKGGKGRASPPHHFITKLAAGVEPHPRREFDHIIAQAAKSPDRCAWFATRAPGKAWRPAPDDKPSVCILFYRTEEGPLDVIAAEIEDRQDTRPDDPSVRELYPMDPGYTGWWRLTKPVRGQLPSLRDLPGRSRASQKTAAKAFAGALFFAYWSLPETAPGSNLLRLLEAPPKQLPS